MKLLPPRVIKPGLYHGRIVESQIVSFPWRQSPENPQGLCLRCVVEVADDEGPAHLLDACDLMNRGRLVAMLASCGIDAQPGRGFDYSSAFAGRSCCITAKSIVPQQGKGAGVEKSVVGSWLLPASTQATA
jgi:hypothetical protein